MSYDFQIIMTIVVTFLTLLTSYLFIKKKYQNSNITVPIIEEINSKSIINEKLDSSISLDNKLLSNEMNLKAKQRIALKNIMSNLTPEEQNSEKEIKKKQMEDIFRLISEQKETFGINSLDDIQSQMKLYTF